MNSFMELCQNRQSCRDFSDQPVERDKLVQCVEAARLAPSGCNSQPWSFVLVTRPDLVKQVAETTKQLGLNQNMHTATAFYIVVEEYAKLIGRIRCMLDSQYFAQHDVGAASLALCLAAQDQGIATCQLGMFDREKLCQLLDIPQHKRIRLVIAAGYPADPAVREKSRKPLDDILRVVD